MNTNLHVNNEYSDCLDTQIQSQNKLQYFVFDDSLLSIYNENMHQILTNLLCANKQLKQIIWVKASLYTCRLCRQSDWNDPSWLSKSTFIFSLERKLRHYIIFTRSWPPIWKKIGSGKKSFTFGNIRKGCIYLNTSK